MKLIPDVDGRLAIAQRVGYKLTHDYSKYMMNMAHQTEAAGART